MVECNDVRDHDNYILLDLFMVSENPESCFRVSIDLKVARPVSSARSSLICPAQMTPLYKR